ncbi:MAG TPA: acyl-ACP--UDP-N-acetylglucosamine O-acyltransferase [Candidatus Eisenbacteria bacterium]|jgi:UDP-N-acetylglucosamine acyltransferase|nr:acyl-ACP--UDP-N-acetylglucosamine O-acyltransferase [Candidatus Eisenbacteria bacterium]
MTTVHETAVVSAGARLGDGVEIGPYAIVGPEARIGRGTRLSAHVVVEGRTTIGERCVVYPGACLGTPPQDKKWKPCDSRVEIGDDNVIRECVTVHLGSKPGSVTRLGNGNFLMVGSHVGHDSVLGNNVTMANSVALGGFVQVDDGAVIGGLAGVHQFCRIGKLAMVGGLSKVVADVPPYSVCDGNPARFYGVNAVGLKRSGFSSKDLAEVKKALTLLFASGLNLQNALKRVGEECSRSPELETILSFVRGSKRGIVRVSAEG